MTLELHTTRFTAIGINRHTFSLLFNQQSIIARAGSESKGTPVRSPLTDAAIVIHNDLCVLSGSNNDGLISGERHSIRRFGMQDILSRRKWDSEMTPSIRLEL